MNEKAQTTLFRKELVNRIQAFFFAEERPYGMALMRIFLPLVLLCMVIPRWRFVRELYSTDGAIVQLGAGFGYPQYLPEFAPAIVVALYTLEILFLIGASIGWQWRICMFGSALLFNYFCMLDVLGTVSKLTVIAGHGLLLLSVSSAGKIWSVDAWIARCQAGGFRGLSHETDPRTGPVWPQRLVQLLLAIIYFSAAITKVNTPAYFSGDQVMYWLVTNINGPKPVGEYLTEYPGFLVISSYIGFIWELLFLFTCWHAQGRKFALGMGVLFHAGTFFMLGLQLFPMVMFCMYLGFLNEEDVRWGMAWVRRLSRRNSLQFLRAIACGWSSRPTFLAPRGLTPALSAMVFMVLATGSAAIGIGVERKLDLYQEHGPNGPLALQEIAPEKVREMINEPIALRDQDKIFNFELGTLEVGGKLWNRRHEYRPGDHMICEVSLNPPHEDMWLECALMDSHGRTVIRPGQAALRENLRSFFNFNLGNDITPGNYSVVLFHRGKEVIRRDLKILDDAAGVAVPLAN